MSSFEINSWWNYLKVATLFYLHDELYSYCSRVRNFFQRRHQLLNSNISFLIYIKAIVKYLPGFNLNIKIWGNCIYFQFCLILIVSVDMVILFFTKKKIQKKIWITQDIDISGDIYQQMSKRQPRKPVIDSIWETREKGRSRSSEWSNTKIWGRKSQYLV